MATKNLSILFVASEVEGLIKSGGLADVAKALPEALHTLQQDVRITLPAYQKIAGLNKAVTLLETRLEYWPHTEYAVKQLEVAGVLVYAIDCPKYYDRPEMYAENNQAYADNGERFAFFSAACLDMLPKLGFKPDIVHANDWHTGFVPYLLTHRYGNDAFFSATKSVLSIHNAVFKGVFSYDELQVLPEMHTRYAPDAAVSPTHVTMLRAGVLNADKVNAVSPTYAQELKTELGSHGMAAEFQQRADDLVGILNGCDYSAWNPQTDSLLPANYKANRQSMVRGKKACKKELQQRVGLQTEDVAVYGMVCRLTNQKGIHYLLPILSDFLKHDVQVVIVGTGDPVLASQLKDIAAKHSDKFAFVEAYSNELAHLVEAGADFFIMPSEFEPCGLNQIYSMAYGTLPIVRGVGGLRDSVNDYDADPQNATGFIFDQPEPYALLNVLQRSLLLYAQQPNEVKRVQLYAMEQNFCWNKAADEYLELYHSALNC
ncbi:glycogen synthase [Vibrio orientalis CIP 102891 = ATCC 33934]|uniref:Glycogen synthase n=1 Tax=Vibrio orientalis CIP 102891 = ATCC 33934 TaxID=675816 RepID=C9QJJ2_VIBOR|nr:glycogen synthase GlgA [Vibrio orientalis]EEX91837.1 glycogen synthase ADP-glucose transglucosylase [Vibrio orientalis CIP 102891 = ATCC 33934]EGU48145.1 glycogen synthase [Vibrio orientalis CIP 102891 = ATCC 33934]